MVEVNDRLFELPRDEQARLRGRYLVVSKKKKIKQTTFAEDLDISVPTLRNCINQGKTSVRTLHLVLRALDFASDDPLFFLSAAGQEGVQEKITPRRTILALLVALVAIVSVLITVSYTTSQRLYANAAATIANDPEKFFKEGVADQKPTELLVKLLKRGLNPEMRSGKQTLLTAAISAGNAEAVIALLRAGASPHAYQDVLDEHTEKLPVFLFPAHGVAKSRFFTLEEKTTVISAMFEKNVAHYMPAPTERVFHDFPSDIRSMFEEYYNQFDIDLKEFTKVLRKEVPLNCSFERDTQYCKSLSEVTGKDQCEILEQTPSVLNFVGSDFQLGVIYVQDLISISDDFSYFFVTHLVGKNSLHGVLEVSSDINLYNLYLWGSVNSGGYGPSCDISNGRCFKRWRIKRISQTRALLNDYEEVHVFESCTPEEAAPMGNSVFDFYRAPE